MKINIKKDANGQPIGWDITADKNKPEEINTINTMRNLQFFGLDDTAIKYNGRTEGNDTTYAGTLHWIQKKHQE